VVEISSKANLKTALQELNQLADENTILPNSKLISVQGGDDEGTGTGAIVELAGIIIGIVVICSIAVIYNSFQISIVERIRQFGLLRAVGATRKQIRTIVLGEATILAVIGVPLGLLFGVGFIYGISIAFKLIAEDSFLALQPVIDMPILGISAGVGIICIYLSSFIPVIFAGNISPIVAISSASAIKKENIKRRNNQIVRFIFGFEGVMAAKNMRRNRKRYIITVFSIVISVVLFITFHYTLDMKSKTSPIPYELSMIDFSVVSQEIKEEYKMNKNLEDNIRNIRFVDKVYGDYRCYFFDAAISKDAQVKEVQDMGDIYKTVTFNGSETTILDSCILVYDKDSMDIAKKYVESGTIDLKKMNQENGVILVGKRGLLAGDNSYDGPMANLKVGDEIALQDNNLKLGEEKPEFGKGYVNKVKVMAIVKIEPFSRMGDMNVLQLMTTEEVAKQLVKNQTIRPFNLNIKITDVNKEEQVKASIENELLSTPYLGLINHISENRKEQETALMIKLLAYGFIIVVSLIGSMNVINTLTTNIILRRKEFAALKSIGLTQKGLQKMVVIEGLLYGIVGTIYGTVISCGLCYLIYTTLDATGEIGFSIPWFAIAIAGAGALLIGYLSVLAPLSRMKKDNLIEALRE
jgi:putative ABC transport system permease protein